MSSKELATEGISVRTEGTGVKEAGVSDSTSAGT